jgi:hypothetical protein
MCRFRLHGTKCSVDLRLDATRRQRREPRLRSAGLNLIAEFVTPFPDVWFCRRHDRKLNTSMDHGGPLYRMSGNQLLLGVQSIRANTGPHQLLGVERGKSVDAPAFSRKLTSVEDGRGHHNSFGLTLRVVPFWMVEQTSSRALNSASTIDLASLPHNAQQARRFHLFQSLIVL